jgi:hypothetical protein
VNSDEGSPEIPRHAVYIDLRSQGDGMGKRVRKILGAVSVSSDIIGDLCETVVHEEPGSLRETVVVADELKVL